MLLEMRRLERETLPAVLDLYFNVYAEEPGNREEIANYFRDFFENNKFKGYVLTDGGELIAASVGFEKPGVKGTEYYIDRFFVRKTLHGRGVGTYFIKLIKKELEKEGIYAVTLATQKGLDAFKFCLKNGFKTLEDSRVLYLKL